jgi:putative peptidoglycan lipid II flippase
MIFEHGAFTAFDTAQTATALSCYAVGLFAYSAVKIMVPVFYALNNTKYPVIGSFLAVAANIVIITLTIDQFQHKAIALSTSCAMILNFSFLGLVLHRKLKGYSLAYIGSGLAKILAGTCVMSCGLWWVKSLLATGLQGSIALQLPLVFLLIAFGALLYGVTLHFLRLPELDAITAKIRQRYGR